MKVRVCPDCGTHNLENAWSCIDCGQTLSVNSVIKLDATLGPSSDTEDKSVPRKNSPANKSFISDRAAKTSRRCKGRTKQGKPCGNYATKDTEYCWQHRPKVVPKKVQCKNSSCKTLQDVADNSSNRYQCEKCGTIFIEDSLWLSQVKIGWRKFPECVGNFEPMDEICANKCNVVKRCKNFSPPIDWDYFQREPSREETEEMGEEIECSTCGYLDRGKFCSRCGSELSSGTSRPVVVKILFGFFEGWPEYFRTVQ